YGALADFRGVLGGFLHGSILSKVGASGKVGAAHPVFPPVMFLSLCPQYVIEQPTTHLLVQACQHLWLVKNNEVYQQFTYVGPIIQPSILAT
ncbi:hypothetical protein ACIOWK_29880, partial [Pseudomonas protegens]|uniref:hypothetical protein n=1 Tax=Pseudomonas protegens TaxID=380021 RepID=UPI00380E2B8A